MQEIEFNSCLVETPLTSALHTCKILLTQLSNSTLRATPPLALFLEIVANQQGGSVTKTQFFKSLQTQLIMRPNFHDVGCKFYHFFQHQLEHSPQNKFETI